MTAADRLRNRVTPELRAASAALAKENVAYAMVCLDRAIHFLAPVAKRAKLPKPEAPGPDPVSKRAAHRESTHDLRVMVWVRCGGEIAIDPDTKEALFVGSGRCEVSGVELGAAWEMHHVESGGARRSKQHAGNVLAVSWDVHRLIHRGDLDALRKVAACPALDAEARRAAQHRVDKVLEARGVPVRIRVAP